MHNGNNNLINSVTHYPFFGKPTVIDGIIQDNCEFKISLMGDTIIIDKDFIDEMSSSVKNIESHPELMGLLNTIIKTVKKYFYSENGYDQSREKFYIDRKYSEYNSNGDYIGAKISKTKGKNIAKCAEKSIASYIILELLFREGKIKYKPSLILSSLSVDDRKPGLHAFLTLDNDKGEYPTKNLLFDPENDIIVETDDGLRYCVSAVYALTDEEKDKIINGFECKPTSIYDAMNSPCHNISEDRIYGSIKLNKTK